MVRVPYDERGKEEEGGRGISAVVMVQPGRILFFSSFLFSFSKQIGIFIPVTICTTTSLNDGGGGGGF